MKIEKYNKDSDYSFTFGAFPTFELLNKKPGVVLAVLVHSKLKHGAEEDKLLNLCKKLGVEVLHDDKTINKIVDKENCYVVGVFKKFAGSNNVGNHLVLVNPSDAGNMGTIMRTALGFGFKNLCIVKPCVDIFNPKVVRASMGAIFSLNIVMFNSVEEYLSSNANKKYFFMLNGKSELGKFRVPRMWVDLVFGNEATGLKPELLDEDESVVIKHSNEIDSLNLPISVGMALYEFTKYI